MGTIIILAAIWIVAMTVICIFVVRETRRQQRQKDLYEEWERTNGQWK